MSSLWGEDLILKPSILESFQKFLVSLSSSVPPSPLRGQSHANTLWERRLHLVVVVNSLAKQVSPMYLYYSLVCERNCRILWWRNGNILMNKYSRSWIRKVLRLIYKILVDIYCIFYRHPNVTFINILHKRLIKRDLGVIKWITKTSSLYNART